MPLVSRCSCLLDSPSGNQVFYVLFYVLFYDPFYDPIYVLLYVVYYVVFYVVIYSFTYVRKKKENCTTSMC